MAINCYTGLQGSGKSYEVVGGPIVEAIRAGRRVVTNIDGVNEEKIRAFIVNRSSSRRSFWKRKAEPIELGDLGSITLVTNERIRQPMFFPDEEKGHWDTVVQPGDLVAVDEAWRIWGTSQGKLSDEHMQFFRMHRHYVHSTTGVACDVVLMTQDISGLHKDLRYVIELSFKMIKLKAIGLRSGYRVEMYDTYKQTKLHRTGQFNRFYRSEIFELYKSYSGAAGKEVTVDKRQNVLANKTLWAVALLLLISTSIAIRSLWAFFHPKQKTADAQLAAAPPEPASKQVTLPSRVKAQVDQIVSNQWRIVGGFQSNGSQWVVLSDSGGRLRLESPSVFQNDGIARIGSVDGERVTTWSGANSASTGSILGGSAK
ncbi:zonular occludens toxin domain-containing protein [Pandoraea sp. ISTKB]|uniref:zonular occludens toxin domain-containing protein n=1 Tax=Pandoraea sp. ISTKB TaxID=1586708 RepID=UPI00084653FF|nr:zonular occludens toxin domain-containing protein [Pandoraea sp. ISTKB]ODP33322.1 hypothetical protein A9762_19390 [Pandoraea sp. ISTKB]